MSDADQNLIEYLAEHDCSCPQCSYNLRGTTKYQCSECGLRFEGCDIERLRTLHFEATDDRRVIRVAQFVLACWLIFIPIAFYFTIVSLRSFVASQGGKPPDTLSWADWITVFFMLAVLATGVGLLLFLQRERRLVLMRRSQKGTWRATLIVGLPYGIIILGGLPLFFVAARIAAEILDLL